MQAKDRIKINQVHRNIKILLDDKVLLEKDGTLSWKFVRIINNNEIYEMTKINFDNKLINYFMDDICEQLDNGVDRNNLILNIPEEIIKIKIGNKIIDL